MSQLGTRLVGNDGRLVKATVGTTALANIPAQSWVKITAKTAEQTIAGTVSSIVGNVITVTADGTTASAGEFVKFSYMGTTYVAKVASSTATTITVEAGSNLPAITGQALVIKTCSMFGDLVVGDFFYNPLTTTMAFGGTDAAVGVTLTTVSDLTSWSFDVNVDEVDTTVLADVVKKFRKGKGDASGQLEFMFIKGTTDLPGNFTNSFLDVKTITATGALQVSPKKTDPLLMIGYLDEDTTAGNYSMAIVMQIELFNFSLPMQDSTAVKASPKFRLSGDINPALYRIYVP